MSVKYRVPFALGILVILTGVTMGVMAVMELIGAYGVREYVLNGLYLALAPIVAFLGLHTMLLSTDQGE